MARPHHFSSPGAFARAVRFESVLRTARARMERGLSRAGHDRRPVLAGPWLSEIGFELLYWIPMLRYAFERHAVAPAQVTALSRGGAADWYAGLAHGYADALGLLSVDAFRAAQRARVAGPDRQKQLTVTPLDRELWARAAPPGAVLVHPLVMYSRLRYFWAGGESPAWLERLCRWAPLPPPPDPGVPLPPDFVAVKPYFSSCFPSNEANRRLIADTVLGLADATDVVLLTTGLDLDDHLEIEVSGHPRVHRLAHVMRPAGNLDLQTRIVARARALVSTYGGPAYLGLFLGVPAVGLLSQDNHNPAHLAAARLAAAHTGGPAPVLVDARRGVAAEEVVEHALGAHGFHRRPPGPAPSSASICSGRGSS